MLIGSTDNPNSARPDEGRLRVTLHHNLWDGVGQRAPRVRFGQVHVYNNLYRIRKDANYVYSWGVGKDSDIYAQSNFFQVDNDVTADEVMDRLNGTQLHERDNLFDGPADRFLTDLVAAYNAANSEDLLEPVPPTWTPTLFTEIEPARHALPSVLGHAGPFTW